MWWPFSSKNNDSKKDSQICPTNIRNHYTGTTIKRKNGTMFVIRPVIDSNGNQEYITVFNTEKGKKIRIPHYQIENELLESRKEWKFNVRYLYAY